MPPKAKYSRKRKRIESENQIQTTSDNMQYQPIDDEELRRSLIEIGVDPGPIDATNREMYIRLLERRKTSSDKVLTSKKSKNSSSSEKLMPQLTGQSVLGSPTKSLVATPRKSLVATSQVFMYG
jgi:arsenate reductase-like glutaredoxin family protein